jgi:hypothetical protein
MDLSLPQSMARGLMFQSLYVDNQWQEIFIYGSDTAGVGTFPDKRHATLQSLLSALPHIR